MEYQQIFSQIQQSSHWNEQISLLHSIPLEKSVISILNQPKPSQIIISMLNNPRSKVITSTV